MQLKYHQKTFDSLNQQPQLSQESLLKLESVPREQGVTIPASIKEWYSLENAIEILGQNSNDDYFVSVNDFGNYLEEGPFVERLLVFEVENQAVCKWAIKLDNSDDPPVFARIVDSDTWELCAENFSTYVWTLVFDWSRIRPKNGYFLLAQARPFTQNDLSELQRNFQEEHRTYCFPGKINYRFSLGDKRILIWSNLDQADWNLSANSPESLFELTQAVWNISNLKNTLYDVDKYDIGKKILEKLKSGAT
jgi:hypothetical protein